MSDDNVETLLSVCIRVKLFNQKRHETGQCTVTIHRKIVMFQSSVLPLDAVVGGDTHVEKIGPECSRPTLHTMHDVQMLNNDNEFLQTPIVIV